MFTGIVESQGIIKNVVISGNNLEFWIKSPLSSKLKVDQSLAHDGVCLTVEKTSGSRHKVTAVEETLNKTTLGLWKKGQSINLERCLKLNSRIDGHLVQGHVDATATCLAITEKDGSWEFTFSYAKEFAPLLIEKGSVCVNGISLTAFNVTEKSFMVAIIPYTYKHTNMQQIKRGMLVNIEFDMMGKYIMRKLSLIQLPKTNK